MGYSFIFREILPIDGSTPHYVLPEWLQYLSTTYHHTYIHADYESPKFYYLKDMLKSFHALNELTDDKDPSIRFFKDGTPCWDGAIHYTAFVKNL